MKTTDEPYRCRFLEGFSIHQLQCHLYFYYPHPNQQTVIISNPQTETGEFASFFIEHLIEQIMNDFKLDPKTTVWMEHYTGYHHCLTTPVFTHITFKSIGKRVRELQRKLITRERAQALVKECLRATLVPKGAELRDLFT